MYVRVNGVRLYFDVEGAALRPSGARMVEQPTLLLLHGGPGVDHSIYKPAFSAFSDVAQVVYLDHRGNGRSEHGASADWTLSQWADDVRGFCDALGIAKPVVYGASFGGMVAMKYAARHPEHPARLILVSTAAQMTSHAQAKVDMFTRRGGPALGRLAQRRFIDGDTSAEVLSAWLTQALPLYTVSPPDPLMSPRICSHPAATAWFNRVGGEGRAMNLLPELKHIKCPTLLLGGRLDPMLPIECQRDIAAAMRPELLQAHEFDHCGHGVVPDVPEQVMPLLRRFISGA